MLLGYAGYRVFEATDGAEALDVARREQLALIISDILMPVMDGIEFANRLHAEPAIAHIPIIFYTATYRASEARMLAQTCGVAAVLGKPAEPQTILDAVSAALGSDSVTKKYSADDGYRPPHFPELAELQHRLQAAVFAPAAPIEPDATAGAMTPLQRSYIYAPGNLQTLSLRTAALLELSMTLSLEREPQQLLELFCRAAQDIMNARYAAVGMRENGQPRRSAQCGMNNKEVEAIFDVLNSDTGTFHKLLFDGKLLRTQSIDSQRIISELPSSHPLRKSALLVPIIFGSHPYGWLYIADKLGASVFNEEDEEFAATLVVQLAPAYENLLLYDEVQQRAGELELEIIERQSVADALQQSETRFRQLAENIHEVFFLVDLQNRQILYVSPAYEEIWGHSCESLYAAPRSWADSIHPDDKEQALRDYASRDAMGRFDFRYRIVRPDGTIRSIRTRGFPIRNAAGEVYRFAGISADITESTQLQAALSEREAGLRRAQSITKLAHVIAGPAGEFESWSETLPQLLGLNDATMPPDTRAWLDIVHPADRAKFRDCCIEAGKTGKRMGVEYRLQRADGAWIQLQQVLEPLEGKTNLGSKMRWFNTIQDITEQTMQARRIARLSRLYAVLSGINSAIARIHDRNELFQEICQVAVNQGAFNMAWIGVIDPDTLDGEIVAWFGGEAGYVEAIRFTACTGTSYSERPACVAVREMRPVIYNNAQTDPALAPLRTILLERGCHSVAVWPIVIDNRPVAVITLFASELDFFDEEEIKLLDELAGDLSFGLKFIDKEEKLSYLAYYDVLTGLANSTLFHDRLAQFLYGAKRDDTIAAVILIDLQHFAHLNNTMGRHAGDAVLKEVAKRLKAALQEPFILARISSDTFAIAVTGLHHGTDLVAILEQQIFEPINQPFSVDRQAIRIAAKAGLALYPDDGTDAETLFRHAEVALKKTKSSNERYLYYASQMNVVIAARLALENGLRIALEMQQFVMYYQPRVDLQSGRIVSAEALIRWQHPQRGLVSPVEFIPLAEETGLIVPIGAWVVDAVCAQQAAWRSQNVAIVPVAVNLSALQFKNGEVLKTIRDAIEIHGLEKQCIEFELTESVVMNDPEEAARNLRILKTLGGKLSLDDFGTGYSSLAYLKRFPFDFVKIDRAFITDITRSPEDAAIAIAVIGMAHNLNLRVVAEGVETEGQLHYLRKHGCDEIQGFYFSHPVAATAFKTMLQEGKQLTLQCESTERANTLLIVDSEPNNLLALMHLMQRDGYNLLTASSGAEALELLAINAVQVIVSDQYMPGMSGTEFLGTVKNLYPDTIRIILSKCADLNVILDNVNRGVVFKFLSRPWEDDLLREHIRDAFHRYRPAQ